MPVMVIALGATLFGAFGGIDLLNSGFGTAKIAAKANISRASVLSGQVRVVDGDSLVMRGIRIRLVGLDAPELSQMCQVSNKFYACGNIAKQFLGTLIGGRKVSCRSEGKDRYQRILARCNVNGKDINAAMVRAGWAIGYYGGHLTEENLARIARRGLWQGKFTPPHQYRRRKRG